MRPQPQMIQRPRQMKENNKKPNDVPSSNISRDDIHSLLQILVKTLSKKFSKKALDRSDVYIKTLLRVFRNFFKKELEVVMGKRRKGKPRPNIIASLEVLAQ
jgi:hypothetical protein